VSGAQATAAARALSAWWDLAGVTLEDAPAPAPAAPAIPRAPALARPGGRMPSVTITAQPANGARAAAAAARTIAELAAAVAAFDGCALKQTARNTVFSDGVAESEVLLLGEAPGKDEDEQGLPFVGRSGQLLDRMVAAAGLSRKRNLLISNVIYWRPPGNRPPTPAELALCLPFAERLVALHRPKLLVLAGSAAAKAMLKRDDGVTKLRGRRLKLEIEGAPVNVLVMLHPAYLLRRPQEKRLAWADMLKLSAWAEELGLTLDARP
jgi:DNA polymerase